MAKKKKGQPGKPKGTSAKGSTDGEKRPVDSEAEERPSDEGDEAEEATSKKADERAGKKGATSSPKDPSDEDASDEEASDEDASANGDATDSDADEDVRPVKAAKASAAKAGADKASAAKAADEDHTKGPVVGHEKLVGAPWALPLVKLDRAWTWFETRLLVTVLLSLVFFMVTWISLKGMSLPLESDSRSATAFRALFGIAVGGGLAQLGTRGRPEAQRNAITLAAILLGAGLAPLWRGKGVTYSEHVLNWLQEGSSLTMFGGLRGISTRLTILLALIGASLAASTGKHINIDVVLRFLSPGIRKLVFIISTVATLVVCVSASWGFFDYISIESFGAKKDASAGDKISQVSKEIGRDLFLWRKQAGLDVSAMFHVLGGGKWDDEGRMNGRSWNAFVEDGGYREHFPKEEVDKILAPQEALDDSRVAMIVVPGGTPRGLLMHALDLIWCWGLINIGLRFVLRMILVATGHASADPEPDEFEGVVPTDEETEAEAEAIARTNDEEAA